MKSSDGHKGTRLYPASSIRPFTDLLRKLCSHGKVDEPNRAWIKFGKVKKAGGTANGMQGLTGLNNKIYYFKVKKQDGIEKYAELYTAKIKKKSIKKEHLVGRIDGRFHCNSIAVIKYDGCTEVYFTETKDTCGQIRRKILNKNDDFINSKIDTIECEGDYKDEFGKKHNIRNKVKRAKSYVIYKYVPLEKKYKRIAIQIEEERQMYDLGKGT